MTVTMDMPVDVGGGGNAWLVGWSSDLADPLFRIYRNGRFVRATRDRSGVFAMRGGRWDVLEVLDAADAPRRTAEPEALIAFDPAAGAVSYRVEEWVVSAWVTRETVAEDGSAYYEVTTNPLTDLQQYQFRVVPVGAEGNDGTALGITVELARHPDPPNVGYAFDDQAKTVTIT